MPSLPKFRLLFAALAATATIGGCQPRDGRAETKTRELMHTSFEELANWSPEPSPNLTTEKAHTGRYSVRVDGQHPYSPSYRVALGALSPHHRPRRFTLSAWVWVPSFKDDASLVAVIANANDPDHPVFRQSVFLTDSEPFQGWKFVSRDLDLPLEINSESQLTVYLWNNNATAPVYADDLLLTELW